MGDDVGGEDDGEVVEVGGEGSSDGDGEVPSSMRPICYRMRPHQPISDAGAKILSEPWSRPP